MLKLTVIRSPSRPHSVMAEKDYDAYLSVTEPGRGILEIRFDTNPEGQNLSSFRIPIGIDLWEDLAKEMMKANPGVAIKAFGAALQQS
jgi:hypothetical protein